MSPDAAALLGPYGQRMPTAQSDMTLRESVDELGTRLARIGAAATILRNLAPDIRHGVPPRALLSLTETLARDLMLASRELEAVHDRAMLELASLHDGPHSP